MIMKLMTMVVMKMMFLVMMEQEEVEIHHG